MALSKRLRFEVFKRDAFTCQYCGKKAPDVVLHVDHIHPRAEGGTDDPINLTTACVDCNLGKGAKKLSDDSAVTKQRAQMELLQERQEQIQMMIDWHRQLANLDTSVVDSVAAHWCELANWHGLNENGTRILAKTIRKFGVEEVLSAMQIAADQYFEYDGTDSSTPTHDSAAAAFHKIGGICQGRRNQESRPYLKDLYYTRAIIRNRIGRGELHYWNDGEFHQLLEHAYRNGVEPHRMHDIAKRCSSWTRWRNDVVDYLNEMGIGE